MVVWLLNVNNWYFSVLETLEQWLADEAMKGNAVSTPFEEHTVRSVFVDTAVGSVRNLFLRGKLSKCFATGLCGPGKS